MARIAEKFGLWQVVKYGNRNAHDRKSGRVGNGRLMTRVAVSLTYITVQIFNCIFSIVKERQRVPYGPYQSHV